MTAAPPPAGPAAAPAATGPAAHPSPPRRRRLRRATPPRAAVLRALGLGDLLTAVPALRALRNALPGHELVLAAPERLADAVRALGTVDRLLPAHAPGRGVPTALPWSGPPPDVAVDLHGCGPPSRMLLAGLRPRRLLVFAPPDSPQAPGPRWRPDEHERDRWCRMLRWYGLHADPGDLALPLPGEPSPAPGAVVLHPGADAPARRWPAERFAAVGRALARDGHRVVVVAGRGEGPLARRVAAYAGLAPDAVAGGERDLPFGRLAALVAHARCVVAGDSGVAHLASALRTPSVVLFGPVAPRLWGPPPDGPHRVLWHPSPDDDPLRPGDAHGRLPDPRLLRISAAEALAAVRALPEPPARS
ncbi:glycosyltransferase family 9 protein [Streptomyces toxytricini]|uniref:Glycosyltransferase family 9 protein n=2 Tax=Streptomyces toxytricini TaxID=67369 RepID=A0ABW8EJD5_STRT5